MKGSFKDGDRECSVKNDIKEMSSGSRISKGEARNRDLCRSRREPGTTDAVGLNQDLCRLGRESGTSNEVNQSQRPLQDRVQDRDLCGSGTRLGTFTETNLSQRPRSEQA